MRLCKRQKILSLLLVAVLTGAAAGVSSAQSGKGKSTAPTPTPAPAISPAPDEADKEVLKIETNLVPLRVTVTDRQGRAITGLKKGDFKVYENGVEQSLDLFSTETAPASWGLVLDRSGSMMEMIGDVSRAALHVIDEGTEQDEIFIATFNSKTEMIQDFTSDRHKLENSVLGLRAEGKTAFYNAVVFALDKIREGKQKKKVLVVITDGEDNASRRVKLRDLIERAEEEDVLIYTVGMFEEMGEMSALRRIIVRGQSSGGDVRAELDKLAEVTGARTHFPADIEGCRVAMQNIAREVSRQYTLGYYPKNDSRDGKWRNIRVVATGASKTNYVARTRTGYYAPKGGAATAVPKF